MSRQRTQPTTIVATPISAAGAPPRKTIASTSDRKLPEIFTAAEVVAAEMSLTIEKTSSEANRARSQLACSRSAPRADRSRPARRVSNRTMKWSWVGGVRAGGDLQVKLPGLLSARQSAI